MRYSLLFFALISLTFIKAQAQDNTALTGRSSLVASSSPAPDHKKRYLGMVELGYLYGRTSNNTNNSVASPSVQFFNGFRAHRMFAVGFTTGFDFYDNLLVTPIALGIRGELANTRVSPFYSLDTGYSSTFLSDDGGQNEAKGGWMFNPSLGIRVKSGNETAFTFGAGYKQQAAHAKTTNWNGWSNQDYTFKRLVLRMGFMF